MNAPLSKSSESTNWLHLYRAAILEMDPSKLSQHVAEAENALTQRARELFQANRSSRLKPSILSLLPTLAASRERRSTDID